MPREATRTANVYTRVDTETKEKAEVILAQLGIPMSNAIGSLTKEQFDAEMQLGMDDIEAGRVVSASSVEEEMRRLYGV